MKKSLLFLLIPCVLLGSCNLLPAKKTSTSTDSSQPASNDPEQNPQDNPQDTEDTDTDEDTDAGADDPEVNPPVVTKQTIGDILSEHKVGEMVSFEATYIRRIAFPSTDLMYFADGTGQIGFRIGSGYEYIKNCYRFREYKITGKLTELNGHYEISHDINLINYKDAVVRLGDSITLSYNENTTTLPLSLANIGQIQERSDALTLDNKSYGYDKIVRFTAQYVQNENEKSSEKTLFQDDSGKSIVVIMDGDGSAGHPLYDLRDINNFGKWYEITGIISVRYSIPAILGLKAKYVAKTETEESHVIVTNATELTTSVMDEIVKGNLTTDKFKALNSTYYYSLYHAVGWVKNNTDITTTYNFGLVFTENGSLSDSGTNKNTVRGFHFVNGTSIGLDKLDYCPFDEYLNKKIEVYIKIESYDNQNHLWKAFVIEDLIEEVTI